MWGFFDVGIAAIVVMQMFLSVTRLQHGCFVWQQGPFACICQDSGGSNPRTLSTPFSLRALAGQSRSHEGVPDQTLREPVFVGQVATGEGHAGWAVELIGSRQCRATRCSSWLVYLRAKPVGTQKRSRTSCTSSDSE